MKNDAKFLTSSIIDNRKRGIVGDFLSDKISMESNLSFVSAYFTIFAYEKLKAELDNIKHLRFLFGEPTFINSLGNERANNQKAAVLDESESISLTQQLTQKNAAIECAKWFAEKAEIRSMVKPNFLHGKLYLIESKNGVKEAVAGSSNFTVNGLGFGGKPNMELNLVVNDKRDLNDLEDWFNDVWNDETGLVEDVKEKVLEYLGFCLPKMSRNLFITKRFFIFSAIICRNKKKIVCLMIAAIFLKVKFGICFTISKKMA